MEKQKGNVNGEWPTACSQIHLIQAEWQSGIIPSTHTHWTPAILGPGNIECYIQISFICFVMVLELISMDRVHVWCVCVPV